MISDVSNESAISPEVWTWVQELIADVHSDDRSQDARALVREIHNWAMTVRAFRRVEQTRITCAETPSPLDLQLHEVCLYDLLMKGKTYLVQAEEFGDELFKLGVNISTVGATVAALEQSLREWHSHGFTPTEVEAARNAIFGA